MRAKRKSVPPHSERLRMNMWQPIETAPQDGTSILVWSSVEGIEIAYFDECSADERWHVGYGHYSYPTHWQTLPESPSE